MKDKELELCARSLVKEIDAAGEGMGRKHWEDEMTKKVKSALLSAYEKGRAENLKESDLSHLEIKLIRDIRQAAQKKVKE